ncbi:MAG: hypothetical protein O3B64_03430 [bacterium]|nr:hypothetical protein [bacterium]
MRSMFAAFVALFAVLVAATPAFGQAPAGDPRVDALELSTGESRKDIETLDERLRRARAAIAAARKQSEANAKRMQEGLGTCMAQDVDVGIWFYGMLTSEDPSFDFTSAKTDEGINMETAMSLIQTYLECELGHEDFRGINVALVQYMAWRADQHAANERARIELDSMARDVVAAQDIDLIVGEHNRVREAMNGSSLLVGFGLGGGVLSAPKMDGFLPPGVTGNGGFSLFMGGAAGGSRADVSLTALVGGTSDIDASATGTVGWRIGAGYVGPLLRVARTSYGALDGVAGSVGGMTSLQGGAAVSIPFAGSGKSFGTFEFRASVFGGAGFSGVNGDAHLIPEAEMADGSVISRSRTVGSGGGLAQLVVWFGGRTALDPITLPGSVGLGVE